MFTQEDLDVLAKRGISLEKAESQLKSFETGFPYLKLKGAASPDYGILVIVYPVADEFIVVKDAILATFA